MGGRGEIIKNIKKETTPKKQTKKNRQTGTQPGVIKRSKKECELDNCKNPGVKVVPSKDYMFLCKEHI